MNPLLKVDSYKIHHQPMYPDNMTLLYSNGTCRKSRMPGVDNVVVFGIQHFVLLTLIKDFNENFFFTDLRDAAGDGALSKEKRDFFNEILLQHKNKMLEEYKRHCPVDTLHIEKLWDLGYLPLEIKALDEGSLCPIGVPMLTITNTHPDFGWLVNYLETLISCSIWQAYTSATIAHEYKKILTKYAKETTNDTSGVQWQGHDFSMRGMSSPESAILSGMGHLLSFTGTDTIPAIYQLENSYGATGLIGASVPATEHSVMCMGTKESEIETFERLLKLYPEGILSVVSDTWDLWKVLTVYLPALKEKILARNGKLVIRPDSGDPVDIICGTSGGKNTEGSVDEPAFKGVIELLWETFGGTTIIGADGKEYRVLDSHIGAIYGDSITLERAKQICERLKAKGFATTNVVLGIGSYTYQYNTRDTFGFAMKATYGELTYREPIEGTGDPISWQDVLYRDAIEPREIWKDPITDDGTKKSKKGLLRVCYDGSMETYQKLGKPADGTMKPIIVQDQQTWEQEKTGLLTTVFKDGKLVKRTTLEEIRNKLNESV